jgi:hypothetical protein
MTNPEDERATPDPGHSRLRASHADREQVTGVLKAAFVQGRFGAYIIGGIIAAIGGVIAAVDGPAVAAVVMVFGVILTAVCAAVAASLIAMTVKLESMHRNRSAGNAG